MVVDIGAQNDSTERTHQIARPESHERKHQRRVFVVRRKKGAPDRRSVISEHHEVVHLEEISQRDANYGSDFAIAHLRILLVLLSLSASSTAASAGGRGVLDRQRVSDQLRTLAVRGTDGHEDELPAV